MSIELKPCPFCGGEAEIKYYSGLKSCPSVYCKNEACAAGNEFPDTDKQAIELWNTRHESAKVSGQVDENWQAYKGLKSCKPESVVSVTDQPVEYIPDPKGLHDAIADVIDPKRKDFMLVERVVRVVKPFFSPKRESTPAPSTPTHQPVECSEIYQHPNALYKFARVALFSIKNTIDDLKNRNPLTEKEFLVSRLERVVEQLEPAIKANAPKRESSQPDDCFEKWALENLPYSSGETEYLHCKAAWDARGDNKRESIEVDVADDRVCINGKWYVPSGTVKDPVQKWQPIETAPKTGNAIMLYGASYGGMSYPMIGYYGNGWKSDSEMYWDDEDGPNYRALIPTHWMPLPKPPTNEIEGGE